MRWLDGLQHTVLRKKEIDNEMKTSTNYWRMNALAPRAMIIRSSLVPMPETRVFEGLGSLPRPRKSLS
jgi:hypothetical protein